ncbi:MAG: translation initiation factor 2, partial [Thermus sp.]
MVTLGTFDGRLLFQMLQVWTPKTEKLTRRLEAVLGSLGLLKRVPPALMPDPKSGLMPAILYLVPGMK